MTRVRNLVLALMTTSAGTAYAQVPEGYVPPPNQYGVSTSGGVDVMTGTFSLRSVDLSVGSEGSKLELVRYFRQPESTMITGYEYGPFAANATSNHDIYFTTRTRIYATPNPPANPEEYMLIVDGDQSYRFSSSTQHITDGAVYTDLSGGGNILEIFSSSGTVTKVILTKSSGEKLHFLYSLNSKYREYPNGSFVTYSNSGQAYSIRNSRGYAINIQANVGTPGVASASAARVSCVNNVVSCATGTLATTSYTYQTSNFLTKLSSFTDPRGKVTTYGYDSENRMVHAYFPSNPTVKAFQNTFCTASQCGTVASQLDANGKSTSFAYGGLKTDALGNQSTFVGASTNPVYGAGAALFFVKDHYNNTINITRDAYGRITKTQQPEGDAVEYTLDARGNVTEERAKAKAGSGLADRVTTRSFPACTTTNFRICNKPSYVIDPRGNRTDYQYDTAHGGVTVELAPADASGKRAVRRYTYASFYPASGMAAPTGITTPSTWLLVAQDDCLSSTVTGTTVDFTFVCPTTDRIRTSWTYTASTASVPTSHELESVTVDSGGLALTTSYTYDVVGNRLSENGPQAGTADTTSYTYDAARQLTRTTYPTVGGVTPKTDIVYDDDGRVLQVKRSLGAGWVTTTTAYDPEGQKTSTTGPDGVTETYTYYDNGLAKDTIRTVDGVARVTRNIYDQANRLTQVRKAVGTSIEQAYATWTYSANAKRLSEQDANGNLTTSCYDGFDRLAELRFPAGSTPPSVAPLCASIGMGGSMPAGVTREFYSYDANNNITQIVKRGSVPIGMAYDALNRMTLKDVPEANRDTTYVYDLAGRRTSAVLPSTNAPLSVSWTYDKAGRMLTETSNGRTLTSSYDTGGTWSQLQWPDAVQVRTSVDALGRPTTVQQIGGTTLATYSFDELSRPTGITRGNGANTTYGYDAQYRLSSLSHGIVSNAVTWNYTYNQATQLKTVQRSNNAYAWTGYLPVNRGYTANGLNQYATSGALSLSYDTRGNLTGDGSVTYTYDSDNRLITASGAQSATLDYDAIGRLARVTSGAQVTNFLYDEQEMVGEYNGSGTFLKRHVHGPKDDDPLATYEAGAYTWTYTDHQGSIVARGNASGTATQITGYDTYGIANSATLGRFGYTGQAYLPELGLYYYKARIYSPTLGRFLQTDPIGTADQINLYAYVANDPVNGRDPTGLCYKKNEVCNYTEAQTRSLLTAAYAEATAGPQAGIENIQTNSRNGGDYDFLAGNTANDTWTLDGEKYNASEMGNFVAGFQAGAYDQKFGGFMARAAVYGAGILDSIKKGDYDLDGKSRPSITAGMQAALGFAPSSSPAPGSASDPHTKWGRDHLYTSEADFNKRNPPPPPSEYEKCVLSGSCK